MTASSITYCDACGGSGWDWSPRPGEPTHLDVDEDTGTETVLADDPAICERCKGFRLVLVPA